MPFSLDTEMDGFGKEAMLMANSQQKWQVFNLKTNKWNKLPKGAYQKLAAEGRSIKIIQPNGGWKTIANADKLPEGVVAHFSKKAADRAAKAAAK